MTESHLDFGPCSWPCLIHVATWTTDHEPALTGPVRHINQHVFTSDGARPGGNDLVGGTGFVLLCVTHTWHPAWHVIGLSLKLAEKKKVGESDGRGCLHSQETQSLVCFRGSPVITVTSTVVSSVTASPTAYPCPHGVPFFNFHPLLNRPYS